MKQKLEKLLKHPEFLVEGQLNKNRLAELARKYDIKLLELLMSDGEVKDHFFSKIQEETSTEELTELLKLAKQSSFLSYRIDPKELKDTEFKQLSLAEKKQILTEIIDNNNLYVNLSDIDDVTYRISENEKKLNKEFYSE